MKNKFFTLLLALIAGTGTISATIASGNCGNNLSWSLDTEEGILVIEGSGDMFNWYSPSDPHWNEYSEYINKVVLPAGLTSIGQYAFQTFTNLTTVEWNCINCSISNTLANTPFYVNRSNISSFVFGEEVEEIPQYLCYEMTNLASVTIPNSVTSIGFQAFYNCSGLETVTIGTGLLTVGANAFYDCVALTSVHITNLTSWCNIEFGSGYIANPLIYAHNLYLNGILVENLVIPDGVTAIKDDAFYNGLCFKSVSIPNTVQSIGNSAFYQCRNLTSITIPNSVLTIGRSAFNICESLESITLGNSVISIGDYAFWNCPFTTITIPSSVESIGAGALTNAKCSAIIVNAENANYCSVDDVLFNKDTTILVQYPAKKEGEYTMPASVTAIGDIAFFYSNLESIIIPEGVESIGYESFGSCRQMTSITLPNSLFSIDRYAFSWCEKLENIVIPDNVTSIAEQAFYYCKELKSVTIGSSVASIGQYAFRDCNKITAIYNRATSPQTIVSNVFADVNKSVCTLYVPEESIGLYEAAEVWRDFTIQAIPVPVTNYTISYIGKDADPIDEEVVTLNVPDAPIIAGFTFLRWDVIAGQLSDGIVIQAVYTYNGVPTEAPAAYTNPANPAQKLIRNGNVYILTGDKTYTITGQEVR